MRLDVYLHENGLCTSRTEAKVFIVGGAVTVDCKIITKPSYEVYGYEAIEVDRSYKKYVSRGGTKLEGALLSFKLNPEGRICIDVGASSGGFTDCLLQNGAKHVIAVDSGKDQIAEVLRFDERVTVVENFNARYMSREDFPYEPSFAVMDVSFISATYIIPALAKVLAPVADFVCLIKPQFEVGRAGLGKGGIVKDARLHREACKRVNECAVEYGFALEGLIQSPILGGDGNTEFLAYFKRRENE